MVKKNLFSNAEAYAAPVCNVLDVKVEGVMCQSYGDPGAAGAKVTNGGVYNFDDE